ncbi:MAG: hypothetical protein AUK55_00090, partial [Syntrophobacteraceae bacterium CG2_30_61_12]
MAKPAKQQPRPRRRVGLKLLAVFVLMAAVGSAGLYLVLGRQIDQRFGSRRWSIPATIFSDTVFCYPGQRLALSDLKQLLLVRRYREVRGREPMAGEYRLAPAGLTVYLRKFEFAGRDLPARLVKMEFTKNSLRGLSESGKPLPFLELEPIVISRLFGRERESRHLISFAQTPKDLIDAVVAIEDRRFFAHRGIDWLGISRALWVDLLARRVVQGGSTITQQLVKNYFLEPDRTLRRKLMEAAMAIVLESRYGKEDILEMYFNEIYLGQRGGVAIHGMGEAALTFFGRNVDDLTLAEAATLAGLIQAPSAYSPYRNAEACKERRDLVLKRMLELGKIDRSHYEQARMEPLRLIERPLPVNVAPYFVDTVRQQLEQLYSPEVLASEGLVVHTSLQPELSLAAEQAVSDGLEDLEAAYPRLKAQGDKEPLQAALVAVQPRTGQVLALVGGRDYAASQFNRALLARRQPGSAFKPFVYLAALDQFPVTGKILDQPLVYQVDGKSWSPRNYDGRYHGEVTLQVALAKSLNAATVNLAMTVGLDPIIDTARRMGIASPLKPYPSLALGAFEVTPFELAAAYVALGNDGQRPYLLSLKKVVTAAGAVEQSRHFELAQATSPAKAFLVTHMLEGVFQFGTAHSAVAHGIDFPCAGKTGTTSDYRDSWFVGYTPDLLVLVWIGFDDNRSTFLSGGKGALRIWERFMTSI